MQRPADDTFQLFQFLVQACVTFEFGHHTLQQNVEQFVMCWTIVGALCKADDESGERQGRRRLQSLGDTGVFVTIKHFMFHLGWMHFHFLFLSFNI